MKSKYNVLKNISILIRFLSLFLSNNLFCMEYQLASGGYDGNIKIWQQRREKWIHTQTLSEPSKDCESGLWTLCSTSCGKYFFSGSADHTIKIWELQNNKWKYIQALDKSSNGHKGAVLALCLSSCGTNLFSGSLDETIKVWAREEKHWKCNQTLDKSVEEHQWGIYSLCLSPCDTYLFSGSWNNTIKMWSKKGNHPSSTNAKASVDRSPKADFTLSKAEGSGRWKCIQTFDDHEKNSTLYTIFSLCISPCGNTLFSGCKSIKVWCQKKSEQSNKWICVDKSEEKEFADNLSFSLCLSHDGNYLFAGYKEIQILAAKESIRTPIQTINKSSTKDSVWSLSASPCGNYLFSGSTENTIKIWKQVGQKGANKHGKWKHIQTLDKSVNGHNHTVTSLCLIKMKNKKKKRFELLKQKTNLLGVMNFWTKTKEK